MNTKKEPTSLQPLVDRVIVSAPPEKDDPNKEQKVDGIIIPSSAQTGRIMDPYYVATVIALGEECKRLQVGQRVVVDRPHLFRVEVDRLDVYMIREANIIAIVR